MTKQILLKIDDNVLAEMRSSMTVRRLAGVTWGLADEFVVKLLASIESGMEEKHFSFKPIVDDEQKSDS